MATLRLLRPRLVALAALAAGAAVWFGATIGERTAEATTFRPVYYAALLSGRDPAAALRKAYFTADFMMRQFGMTRIGAATKVARFMIQHGGRPCVGG